MDTIQVARKVLRDAEASLRDLIHKALEEQRYGDVKEIAELADGVTRLVNGSGIVSQASSGAISPATLSGLVAKQRPKRSASSKKRRTSAKDKYPWFARDGDRLVKVGWSKKNRKVYEHRVPREIMVAFVQHLVDSVHDNKIFDVDSLLPVNDPAGHEIPAYQVYVTLAWLRKAGIVEKKGRDGYVIRDRSIVSGELHNLWNGLPTRTA